MCISYDAMLRYPASRLSYLRGQPAILNRTERFLCVEIAAITIILNDYFLIIQHEHRKIVLFKLQRVL